jgi:hypothetical protein
VNVQYTAHNGRTLQQTIKTKTSCGSKKSAKRAARKSRR